MVAVQSHSTVQNRVTSKKKTRHSCYCNIVRLINIFAAAYIASTPELLVSRRVLNRGELRRVNEASEEPKESESQTLWPAWHVTAQTMHTSLTPLRQPKKKKARARRALVVVLRQRMVHAGHDAGAHIVLLVDERQIFVSVSSYLL